MDGGDDDIIFWFGSGDTAPAVVGIVSPACFGHARRIGLYVRRRLYRLLSCYQTLAGTRPCLDTNVLLTVHMNSKQSPPVQTKVLIHLNVMGWMYQRV